MAPPVKTGEQLQLYISDLNHAGEGVGKYYGFTIFVPLALPGERIWIQVKSVKSNFARGKIIEILEDSKNRVAPPCPYFQICGGCQLQHLDYEFELNFKRKHLAQQLEKMAGVDQNLTKETVGMKTPWYYRNNMQVQVKINDQARVGFFKPKTYQVVQIDACLIQHQINNRVLKRLTNHLNAKRTSHEEDRPKSCGYCKVMVRSSYYTGETQLSLASGAYKIPNKEQLIQDLKCTIPEVVYIEQAEETDKNKKSLPMKQHKTFPKKDSKNNKNIVCHASPYITEQLLGKNFKIAPGSFFQVNTLQAENLYSKLLEAIDFTPIHKVLDLYCGIGTMTILAADHCKYAIGIESEPEAVQDAETNSQLNGCNNVSFIQGKVENKLKEEQILKFKPELVILDPPRTGCDKQVIQKLGSLFPSKIAYVSCDPATLARDVNRIKKYGYKVHYVQPVDMFPKTTHIESLTLLSK